MDILIPLGTGSTWQNNELRYCLRSIERFATGFDRIFITGIDPGFLNTNLVENGNKLVVRAIPDIAGNKQSRIAYKILNTFKQTDISDEIIFFNDDFVLNGPVDLSSVPYYQRGDLLVTAPRHQCSLYRQELAATHAALQSAGKPTYHYDIHCPIIYRRQEFIALEDWWIASRAQKIGCVVKSIYANNVLTEPGPYMSDCKVRGQTREQFEKKIKGRWIFSYGDEALKGSFLKNWLASKFPEKSTRELNARKI